jgi:hypothetical protein
MPGIYDTDHSDDDNPGWYYRNHKGLRVRCKTGSTPALCQFSAIQFIVSNQKRTSHLAELPFPPQSLVSTSPHRSTSQSTVP